MEMTISTGKNRQMIDLTDSISSKLPAVGSGIAVVFVRHTTCAITTIDSDPDIDLDLFDFLEAMTPHKKWRHPHNPAHAPDHLLSSLIGPSVSVPFENGQLQLGTWQRIILIELNGPRERLLTVSIIKGG